MTEGHSRAAAPLAVSYALLSFAILLWGGNFVVGRLANLDVPPIALSFWRHLAAAAMVLPFVVPAVRRDWKTLRPRLATLAGLTFLFVTGNTLVYYSVLYTSVTNAALINAGLPVMAVFFSWMILGELVNRWQALGIALCFGGIVTVVTRADIGVLLRLESGWGDLFMLLAIMCWALYMVLLKRTGLRVSPWTLLFVVSAGSTLWLVPAYGVEIALGFGMAWTWLTAASVLYVALFSTVVAWACWNSGMMRIGPNRASSFMSLHPVFGAALGMIFFDEAFRPYHVLGTVVILLGVWLVSRVYPRTVAA